MAIMADLKEQHPEMMARLSVDLLNQHLQSRVKHWLDEVGPDYIMDNYSTGGGHLFDGLPGSQLPLFAEFYDQQGVLCRKATGHLILAEFKAVVAYEEYKVEQQRKQALNWKRKLEVLEPTWSSQPDCTFDEILEARAKELAMAGMAPEAQTETMGETEPEPQAGAQQVRDPEVDPITTEEEQRDPHPEA
jgi:hypothetical protein